MVESDTRAAHFTDTGRNVKPPEPDIWVWPLGDEDIRGHDNMRWGMGAISVTLTLSRDWDKLTLCTYRPDSSVNPSSDAAPRVTRSIERENKMRYFLLSRHQQSLRVIGGNSCEYLRWLLHTLDKSQSGRMKMAICISYTGCLKKKYNTHMSY